MTILVQFLLRAAFGLATAMAVTPSDLVTSGFYRVHLWVILGAAVLCGLVAWQRPDEFSLWPPMTVALLSYAGSIAWLYEKNAAGVAILVAVAAAALAGALLASPWPTPAQPAEPLLRVCDIVTSGLLIGIVLAAMLLGHWYLNTPSMEILPLQRLVSLLLAAVALRLVVCGAGIAVAGLQKPDWIVEHAAMLSLRWLAGILGTGVMGFMTWETLKIPNTQSATGILYVGVILVFLGEMISHLLGATVSFPV